MVSDNSELCETVHDAAAPDHKFFSRVNLQHCVLSSQAPLHCAYIYAVCASESTSACILLIRDTNHCMNVHPLKYVDLHLSNVAQLRPQKMQFLREPQSYFWPQCLLCPLHGPIQPGVKLIEPNLTISNQVYTYAPPPLSVLTQMCRLVICSILPIPKNEKYPW